MAAQPGFRAGLGRFAIKFGNGWMVSLRFDGSIQCLETRDSMYYLGNGERTHAAQDDGCEYETVLQADQTAIVGNTVANVMFVSPSKKLYSYETMSSDEFLEFLQGKVYNGDLVEEEESEDDEDEQEQEEEDEEEDEEDDEEDEDDEEVNKLTDAGCIVC